MPIFISVLYGALTVFIIISSYKYYIPYLQQNIKKVDSDSLTVNSANLDGETMRDGQKTFISRHKLIFTIVLIILVLLSVACGYIAAVNASSAINLVKITIAYAVLLCAVMTDIELMIIPNSCSLVFIGARILIFFVEVVTNRNNAVVDIIDSLVAMILCLLILILASKITKGGIGYGDVKLFSSFGFLCGIRAVCYTLTLAFLLSALISTFLLLFRLMKLKDSLPLGPFIWLGFVISVMLSIL